MTRGWLARYAAMVTSADTGAVLAIPAPVPTGSARPAAPRPPTERDVTPAPVPAAPVRAADVPSYALTPTTFSTSSAFAGGRL